MYDVRRVHAALAFQMCTCHLPVLFKTFPGYAVITKEVGIKTSEVEPLTFIHHLYFSES